MPQEQHEGDARIEDATMHTRRITLPDKRYLIFYTFDEPDAVTETSEAADSKRPEPRVDAETIEATEERHV